MIMCVQARSPLNATIGGLDAGLLLRQGRLVVLGHVHGLEWATLHGLLAHDTP